MYERLEYCPVCKSESYKNHLIVKDHTVSQESFVIVQCDECDFRFTNPRPTKEEIGKYYKSEEYISHTNKSTGLVNKVYQLVRIKTLNDKLSFINKLHSKGKLLDIGCGTGHFLKVARKGGWQVEGVEPDSDARQLANQTAGIKVHESFLETKFEGRFDVITMWHVLEHVHELENYIKKLKSLLTEKGKLVIAVPNCDSYDAEKYKENWAAYDVPRHLYHFTPPTITKLFSKHGFSLKLKKGMYFDAYYVSLLSERYKLQRDNYVNAIKEGFESNNFGKQENNYSSMIYVFEK